MTDIRAALEAHRLALLGEVRESLTDLMGRQYNRKSVAFGDLIHWLDDLDLLQPDVPALAAASPEPVLCEHYEPGDCPICDQPAPAARADERTRLGDHP